MGDWNLIKFDRTEACKADEDIVLYIKQINSQGNIMLENETQLNNAHQVEIEETLKQRGDRYGNFMSHAFITQNLKKVMHKSPKWGALTDDKKEALEMIAHKIGRILNGDPEYKDSWHDIIGYTKLVEDTLLGMEQ